MQTQWGPVQVQVTASGGKITDVTSAVPQRQPEDQEINDYALPVLVQETMDAQSAEIDMVSGATVTSDGYSSRCRAPSTRPGCDAGHRSPPARAGTSST